MSDEGVTTAVRVTWLVLCGMMLFSRFLFQGAGAVWMRRFLDTWKGSHTHRVWGWAAFVYGVLLLTAVAVVWAGLSGADRMFAAPLVGILCADGLLNLVPSWFGHFKERMQDAWIRRHSRDAQDSDRQLFGTVNIFLGAASVAVGATVYLYRPMAIAWLLGSAVIAVVLTLSLVGLCTLEMRQQASPPNHYGLESVKPDLQSVFRKPGGGTAEL